MTNTYSEAGVDVVKSEKFVSRLKKAARRPGHETLWKGAGGYASVVPLTETEAVALTTDGVGTKLLIACEFGNLKTIGIDLVAMCANDLVCVGATPKSFLDYYATPKLDDKNADELIDGIVLGCDQADMLLVGGETAELPGLYQGNHFDIAGFAMGTVSKKQLIDGSKIKAGDVVIGVASSGIHSNGLSLARKVIGESHKLRQELLTPTLIYVRPVAELLASESLSLHGIVHVTGGGWRNLFRLNESVGFSLDAPLPVPPILEEISKDVEIDEMYRTFNMGMGLALYVSEKDQNAVIDVFKKHKFTAQRVGTVVDTPEALVVKRPDGKVIEIRN